MSDLKICYRSSGAAAEISESDENLIVTEYLEGSRHVVEVKALRPLRLSAATLRMERKYCRGDLFLTNGYQSWTETREFARNEYLNDLTYVPSALEKKYHFKAYGSQAFWRMKKGSHLGFDYAYVKGRDPLFIGNYNYKNAYLLIRFRPKDQEIVLDSDVSGRRLLAGETFTLFDYTVTEDGKEYFERLRPRTDKKLVGYTSWYNHYQNIHEGLIMKALDSVDRRFDLFQIDDGFETFVGDWLDIDPEKFPHGLKPVVDRIHERGMLAGIWLAPFVAEDKSRLISEHPDWIARNSRGEKIYAGGNWSGHCALDLNHPETIAYIRRVLRYYRELGFDFFKLDFLYASNLCRLKGKTRSETAEFAYKLLREELDDRLILGCGATLSNAFERFDYCRIGPDVSLKFDDEPYMRLFHPERISTRVTLQNTIFRSSLNGHAFMNDPDVFLLRDDNISMSRAQRISLTLLNAMFGSLLMTSDDIAGYDEKKRRVFEMAMEYFRSGSAASYERRGRYVHITAKLRGNTVHYRYDTGRGLLRREDK